MARELVLVVCTNCDGAGKVGGLDTALNYIEQTCERCMGRGKRTVNIGKGSRAPRLEDPSDVERANNL